MVQQAHQERVRAPQTVTEPGRHDPRRRVQVLELGTVDYARAVDIQGELAAQRLASAAPDTLLLLEHPPVITLGRRAALDDVYLSPERLAQLGVALARTSRGGLVTYHGPGQLVGYPILKLHALG